MYTLSEYSYLTGCGHTVGSAGCVDKLPWGETNGLDTYLIRKGSVDLAEFEGSEALAALEWFDAHPDYDGSEGCKAWKGFYEYAD